MLSLCREVKQLTLTPIVRPYNNFSDFELQILSTKVCLIHYNARPHASAQTQQELIGLKWEIFEYPPYS